MIIGTDPASGKPIRKVTTDWLLENDKSRYDTREKGIQGAPRAGLRGGHADNADKKKAVCLALIIEMIRKEGKPIQQKRIVDTLGIKGTYFCDIMRTMGHDLVVRRKRKKGMRGERFMVWFNDLPEPKEDCA